MDPWLIWLLAGLLLVGAELLLPGAYLLWAGLAAIGTGLAMAVLNLSFPAAVILFVVLLAAGVAIALRRRRAARPGTLNTPESGLVGRTGTILASLPPDLRVRVGDSDWAAQSEAPLAAGATVRVVGVRGTTLLVQSEA